ncbi:MAG: response regulator [Myxococcota bacterium]|nr:response regulator [Myxococcota bacterium]
MSLSLEYPDKYRLWADLIQANSDRVFIAADQLPPLGALVPVKLTLPGVPLHVAIEGMIVGRRTGSARFRSGVYVRFPDDQIEKCRRFLGLTQSPERYEQGRKAERIRCELKLTLLEPATEGTALAKNLSLTGLLMISPVDLLVGQQVRAALTLDDGAVLPLEGEVSWARNDKRLVGLRFSPLSTGGQAQLQAAVERLSRNSERGRHPPIVVADDEPHILEFLSKALNKSGYQVRKAHRGEEALDVIREVRPALVILDILMPGIDGVDICKMMRADVEMADIPVIFLSALDAARLHQVADEAGATDYLAKPVSLADLINLVGTYLKAEPAPG